MSKEIITPKIEEIKNFNIDLGTDIVLCQCFGCKKNYVQSLMKSIKVKVEEEDSYITCKRYLCENCMKKLEQLKWVQEEESKRKNDE